MTKTKGNKFDDDKPPMDLLPGDALMAIAEGFAFGKKKYGAYNWAHGMRWGQMLAAAVRHIYKFTLGHDKDEESGLPHLAHAGCCILMALSYYLRKVGEDDRFKEKIEVEYHHYNGMCLKDVLKDEK